MTTHPSEPSPSDPKKSESEVELETILHGDQSPRDRVSLSDSVTIGPYRLLQKIGEGGMGEVWMAEQKEPVRRRVALKLIRGNATGSRDVIARFEAERQALALMNHPNIARILDAGATVDGHPFFVMELVTGKSLTQYCDHHKLSIEDRLRLFRDVCSAVQHAHQKGIIHRDLKPSNILISEIDGKPLVKIIDFGLAKALESASRLTDQSLYTGIGQILGTLKYMSPEQASLDFVDIDTRTDIYSLGVILYELLTGTTPIDDDTIRKRAMFKTLEVIREQESPRPSSKLSNSKADLLQAVAEQRCVDTGKLRRILARDLDWVIMKAIEKERARRYESASGLGAEIERYLAGEPVVARPPSIAYRSRKFVRKHFVGVIITSLLTLFVGAVSFGLLMQWFRDKAVVAQKRAEVSKQAVEKQKKIAVQKQKEAEDAQMAEAEKRERALIEAQIAKDQERYARKFEQIVNEQKELAVKESARTAKLLQQTDQTRLAFERLAAAILPARDDWPTIPAAELATKLDLVGSCRLDIQQYIAAEDLLLKALEIRQRETPEAWETFQTRSMLGEALFRQDRFADAEPHLVAGYEGLATRQDTIPPNVGTPIADALDRLIALYERLGQTAEVERYRSLRGK